jgi:type II secretory pathway component PulF
MDRGASAGRWRYHAAGADGSAVRGEIDASSERDAVDALRRRSLWVIELTPIDATDRGATLTSTSRTDPSRRRTAMSALWDRVSGRAGTDVAVVMRAMATLLAAGVPLHRALTYAEQEASTEPLRAAFAAVREGVQRGESLSVAMAAQAALPTQFAPLIAAGESSGTLNDSLTMLADHLERRDALRAKLRGALIYPTILGIASIVGVVVILLVVVPRFAALISESGGTLPASTRALIALSTLVTRGWWMILIAVSLAAALGERLLNTASSRQRLDESRLGWLVTGRLERLRASAAYTGTLAIGLRSGVPLLSAMALARGVIANRYLATALAEAESRVRGGSAVSTALSGLLSPLAERLIDAGETSGDLAGMAARAADAADGEVERALGQAVALIEPVMILGFGGVVGFVALALLQAIYGLNARVL